MKVHKTIELCDRCHKEFGEHDVKHYVNDWNYFYLLCDLCNDDFQVYKEITTDLERAIDAAAKKYQFNKYLPKYEGRGDVEW